MERERSNSFQPQLIRRPATSNSELEAKRITCQSPPLPAIGVPQR